MKTKILGLLLAIMAITTLNASAQTEGKGDGYTYKQFDSTYLNGRIYLHLHITLGKTDYTALAGHLLKATLNGEGKFVINKYSSEVPRYHNDRIGLNMYRFCM